MLSRSVPFGMMRGNGGRCVVYEMLEVFHVKHTGEYVWVDDGSGGMGGAIEGCFIWDDTCGGYARMRCGRVSRETHG